jgi:hypothetical protein
MLALASGVTSGDDPGDSTSRACQLDVLLAAIELAASLMPGVMPGHEQVAARGLLLDAVEQLADAAREWEGAWERLEGPLLREGMLLRWLRELDSPASEDATSRLLQLVMQMLLPLSEPQIGGATPVVGANGAGPAAAGGSIPGCSLRPKERENIAIQVIVLFLRCICCIAGVA